MFANLAKRLPVVTSRCTRKYSPHKFPSADQRWPQLPSHYKWYSNSAPPPNQSGARDRAAVGVFTPKAAALFVLTGVGLYFYFDYEKRQLQERRRKELETTSFGRPQVGGPFNLVTHANKPLSEKDLLGKWNLVYFGFTNCPDICPAELDKVGAVLDELEKDGVVTFQPIFISVDPARDTLQQISLYLRDFHPSFIGATGPPPAESAHAAIKSVCKAYRVYFSTPPDADPKGDYLVDHSIFSYLMDPNGDFVEAFGQSSTAKEVVERIRKEVGEWKGDGVKKA